VAPRDELAQPQDPELDWQKIIQALAMTLPQGRTVTGSAYPDYRWLEWGNGVPVVFLPGLMGQIAHWEAAVRTLGDVCRAMALELPIFDPALPEASIGELTRYTHRFLDVMAMPGAVVGGNSLGGQVALELALTHPGRVAGLVLTGSSGLFERGFTRGVPRRPSADYVRRKMEEVVYDPALVTAEWVEEIRVLVTTPTTAQRVLAFAREARRHRLDARLPQIRVPTLLVWGQEDRVTPPELAQQFQALIPDSTLVVLPACGHVPMLEQPDGFNAAVRAWLQEHKDRLGRREATAEVAP
jgi:2-hydroxy-6-oxonona-2,4-dienedioate hydrolase